jgi:hypothetical protein
MTSVEQEEGDFEHHQVGVDVQPRHDLAPQGGRRLFALRRLLLGVAVAHPVHGHPANHNNKKAGSGFLRHTISYCGASNGQPSTSLRTLAHTVNPRHQGKKLHLWSFTLFVTPRY